MMPAVKQEPANGILVAGDVAQIPIPSIPMVLITSTSRAQGEDTREQQVFSSGEVSPESWRGGQLSARGLDALYAIREAANRKVFLRQDSDQSFAFSASSPGPGSGEEKSPRLRRGRRSPRRYVCKKSSGQEERDAGAHTRCVFT